MSAFCVTRPRPFSLSRERSPISKQMPRHNDGEQQVDVLKWHGGPQCPEGLHKARAASLSSSLNDDFSILDRALQHLCRRPRCPVTGHNSDRLGEFGSYTKNL